MSTLGQRLRDARVSKRLTQGQLAGAIRAKHNSVSNWENGRNCPDYESLELLCHALSVDANYFFGHKNPPAVLSSAEAELIEKFRLLPDEGRYSINNILDLIVQKPVEDSASSELPSADSGIRIYTYPAAAGISNPSPTSDYELWHGDFPDKADFGVRISGDSMAPAIPDSSVVWVHSQPALENGEIGIFSLNDETYCKKYILDDLNHLKILRSVNPKYSDIVVGDFDTLAVVGKVIGNSIIHGTVDL